MGTNPGGIAMMQPKIGRMVITANMPPNQRVRVIEIECDLPLNEEGKRFKDDLAKFLSTWPSDEKRIREIVNEMFVQKFPDAKIPKDGA